MEQGYLAAYKLIKSKARGAWSGDWNKLEPFKAPDISSELQFFLKKKS